MLRTPKVSATDPIESKEEKKETVSSSSLSSDTSPPKKTEESKLAAPDFSALFENEHFRYLKNSNKIGHAVIVKNKSGEEIAVQYSLPKATGKDAAEIRPLKDIEAINPFQLHRFRAVTPDHNTPMFATRFIDLEVGNTDDAKVEQMQIACFSPRANGEPFWGQNSHETPIFATGSSKEKNDKKSITKAGAELVIKPESVRQRELYKTRKPDQNTVMGMSAKDAYENFLNKMMRELHPEMKERLKRAIDAPLKSAFHSNYRPEWLHAEGFWATPISKDPQRKDNLGAAPKWANTEMMVLERIAKWFALNRPYAFVKIRPHFEMLLNSEIIKKINFKVTLQEKKQFINLLQTIDPFEKFHLFRKASDVAQGAGIVASMLQNIPPVIKQKVLDKSVASSSSLFSSIAMHETSLVSPKTKKSKASKRIPLKYEKSVVQIITTSQDPSYDEPWAGTQIACCSGTGLVVAHEDKKYILTNAHCVENSAMVRIRLANDRKKKYEAKRKCISYQCDLALLEVTNPDFLASAEAVELGEMASAQEKVYTVGFPMGGSEISISKGIVSRIEVRDYCMSGLDMLQVQVDAAINPGNSGGPVFSNGKVIGVAFQGIARQQGLGYMIPIPIIKHFLNEALTKKRLQRVSYITDYHSNIGKSIIKKKLRDDS